MEQVQPASQRFWRPRFSVLAAILLMTIVGMAIVIAQLWREIGPLRNEVQRLRDQVGVLTIEDRSKIHAIDVPTDHEGTWKWRVYVPKGQHALLHDRWGDIAGSGYPPARHQWILDEGEQIVTLSVKNLGNDSWIGQFRTPKVVATISISPKDFFQSASSSSRNATVGSKSVKIDDGGKLLLMRSRVTPSDQSKLLDKDEPLPGFIIWLERQ
jgi:hypothetical protein